MSWHWCLWQVFWLYRVLPDMFRDRKNAVRKMQWISRMMGPERPWMHRHLLKRIRPSWMRWRVIMRIWYRKYCQWSKMAVWHLKILKMKGLWMDSQVKMFHRKRLQSWLMMQQEQRRMQRLMLSWMNRMQKWQAVWSMQAISPVIRWHGRFAERSWWITVWMQPHGTRHFRSTNAILRF